MPQTAGSVRERRNLVILSEEHVYHRKSSYEVRGCNALACEKRCLECVPAGKILLHDISIDDIDWMRPLLQAEDSVASMGCFGTMYLWGNAFGQQVAKLGDRIVARYESDEGVSFAYPYGSGDLRAAVLGLKEMSEQSGYPLTLIGLTEEQKDALEQAFPQQFAFEESRDNADYVYGVEQLANLKGKKLQNKRNHCNRFEKEQSDWKFEPMERRHFDDCRALMKLWGENHADSEDFMQDAERRVVEDSFEHFERLGMEGGVLYVDGRLVAFTFGEAVGQNGFDVHLEKADISLNGTYQMINREFVRHLQLKHPDLRYINREEDMGHENLRKAKLSYHPEILLTKYNAKWRA